MLARRGDRRRGQLRPVASRGRSTTPRWPPTGAQVFLDNCAACHMDDGTGDRNSGAPNLTDAIWLYGGTRDRLIETVTIAPLRRDAGLGRQRLDARPSVPKQRSQPTSTRWAAANRSARFSDGSRRPESRCGPVRILFARFLRDRCRPTTHSGGASRSGCAAARGSLDVRSAGSIRPDQRLDDARSSCQRSMHLRQRQSSPFRMSATEPQQLYAAREPVFPRRVPGTFRTLKWWIMVVTLGIYYLTPWIRWDRGPNAARPGGPGRPRRTAASSSSGSRSGRTSSTSSPAC